VTVPWVSHILSHFIDAGADIRRAAATYIVVWHEELGKGAKFKEIAELGGCSDQSRDNFVTLCRKPKVCKYNHGNFGMQTIMQTTVRLLCKYSPLIYQYGIYA
jgi:hypothetical protein